MDYQWYPGHMTKARRRMEQALKLVDLVIELTDARTVRSGRNPDIAVLASGKSRILLMTKADLADASVTAAWVEFYQKQGVYTAALNARNGTGMKTVRNLIDQAGAEKMARNRARGIVNQPIRAMIAGIPNVGKSTLINSLCGRASAKTGNKPGVTRGEQWIRAGRNLELLDTPGILWPKFEDRQVGIHLSLTGTIRDELLDENELAMYLCEYLKEHYPGTLKERYGIDEQASGACDDQSLSTTLLTQIAHARSLLRQGGLADESRAAKALIDDFRSGKLGKISLEIPQAAV